MINVNNIDNISALLSYIFFFGLFNGYSETTIEEKIINSYIISSLEKGDDSFLYSYTNDEIVEHLFNTKINEDLALQTNPLCLWLGEVYTKIFFSINKSFSFIFLYLPLNKAIKLYDLFHEMDITQMIEYFNNQTNKKSILSLLIKKRKITLMELSTLSGVNYNTLVAFSRSNEHIYSAKMENIYKISQILDVNINIFVKQINNFTNSEIYEFDKYYFVYRLFLGCCFASYYNTEIARLKYELADNILVSSIDKLDVILYTKEEKGSLYDILNRYKVKQKNISDINLVIFDYNKEEDKYLNLTTYGYKRIIIIINNDKCVTLTKNGFEYSELTSRVVDGVIWQAKSRLNGDFAV